MTAQGYTYVPRPTCVKANREITGDASYTTITEGLDSSREMPPEWRMREPVVAVPARNEADRLPHLLTSLASQTWFTPQSRRLRMALVLNNCHDASVAVTKSLARRLPCLSLDIVEINFAPAKAHAGAARRLAMDRALVIGGSNAVLLTTDADAVPNSNWIEANLRAIAAGADLVGGHIIGNPAEEAQLGPGFVRRAARHLHYTRLVDRLTDMIDPNVHDPWPRHTDHTGASLAVCGKVYAQIGGIPELPCGEDIAFVANAVRAGFRLRHPPDVQVQVSARLDGRADGGRADCLKGWVAAERDGLPHLVEDPLLLVRRLHGLTRHGSEGTQSGGSIIWPDNGAGRGGNDFPEVEIETAIKRLERLIACRKGLIDVA
jgi:GT2 family glycosyltransferase